MLYPAAAQWKHSRLKPPPSRGSKQLLEQCSAHLSAGKEAYAIGMSREATEGSMASNEHYELSQQLQFAGKSIEAVEEAVRHAQLSVRGPPESTVSSACCALDATHCGSGRTQSIGTTWHVHWQR